MGHNWRIESSMRRTKSTEEGKTRHSRRGRKVLRRQCQDTEDNSGKKYSKKAYKLVKTLTSTKQGKPTRYHTIQRREKYRAELYSHTVEGDLEVLIVSPVPNTDNYPILREEVEAAGKSLMLRWSLRQNQSSQKNRQASGKDADCVIGTSHIQKGPYHVFIDFENAFDREWYKVLWSSMRFCNFNANLIQVTTTRDCFRTTVGVTDSFQHLSGENYDRLTRRLPRKK